MSLQFLIVFMPLSSSFWNRLDCLLNFIFNDVKHVSLKRLHILRNQNDVVEISEHQMIKDEMKGFTVTGYINSKTDRNNQKVTYIYISIV